LSADKSHQILLIGKHGQLGFELNRILAPLVDVVSVDIEQFDLTKPTIIRSMVRQFRPNLIVNAAAYTDVEKAEEEPELAHAVNSNAPGLLTEEAKSIGAGIVHYSTDYVFDGSKRSPYLEEDPPNPRQGDPVSGSFCESPQSENRSRFDEWVSYEGQACA